MWYFDMLLNVRLSTLITTIGLALLAALAGVWAGLVSVMLSHYGPWAGGSSASNMATPCFLGPLGLPFVIALTPRLGRFRSAAFYMCILIASVMGVATVRAALDSRGYVERVTPFGVFVAYFFTPVLTGAIVLFRQGALKLIRPVLIQSPAALRWGTYGFLLAFLGLLAGIDQATDSLQRHLWRLGIVSPVERIAGAVYVTNGSPYPQDFLTARGILIGKINDEIGVAVLWAQANDTRGGWRYQAQTVARCYDAKGHSEWAVTVPVIVWNFDPSAECRGTIATERLVVETLRARFEKAPVKPIGEPVRFTVEVIDSAFDAPAKPAAP